MLRARRALRPSIAGRSATSASPLRLACSRARVRGDRTRTCPALVYLPSSPPSEFICPLQNRCQNRAHGSEATTARDYLRRRRGLQWCKRGCGRILVRTPFAAAQTCLGAHHSYITACAHRCCVGTGTLPRQGARATSAYSPHQAGHPNDQQTGEYTACDVLDVYPITPARSALSEAGADRCTYGEEQTQQEQRVIRGPRGWGSFLCSFLRLSWGPFRLYLFGV